MPHGHSHHDKSYTTISIHIATMVDINTLKSYPLVLTLQNKPQFCLCPHACIQPSGNSKRNSEKQSHIYDFTVVVLTNLTVLSLTIFHVNYIVFGANRQPVISQHTDQFLSCRCHCSLAFIEANQRCKKNVKKPLCICNFPVLSLTIFSFILLFSGQTYDLWYLITQNNFCPAATTVHMNILWSSGDSKKTVRRNHVFTILH